MRAEEETVPVESKFPSINNTPFINYEMMARLHKRLHPATLQHGKNQSKW
jgi:hypothetical protein